MARDTRIFKTLQKYGLKVEYVKGWTTRGSAYFDPEGVLDHWTAGPRGATGRPSLRVCTYGHSTLPGPLCNVYLARDGVAVVVAAGRANHAGYGLWKGLTGNTKLFGIEAEAADGDDWTDAQREAYPKVNAALLELAGTKDASYVAGHSEYALPRGRKIDIDGYTTDEMRRQTQAVLNGTVTPTAPSKPKPIVKEWSDMASEKEIENAAYRGALKAGRKVASEKPTLKGKAAEIFAGNFSRDDVLGYAGASKFSQLGAEDIEAALAKLDAGVDAQEVADLILARTDKASAEAIVDALADRLK